MVGTKLIIDVTDASGPLHRIEEVNLGLMILEGCRGTTAGLSK